MLHYVVFYVMRGKHELKGDSLSKINDNGDCFFFVKIA
jgi:hypothetical protein